MIPFPVAPLKGVTVLVTRPAEQADNLCARIAKLGGEALRFPAIAIEPIEPEPMTTETMGIEASASEACARALNARAFDWLIFISANAVRHGLSRVQVGERTRIVAIGKATAAALKTHGIRIDVLPEVESTEGLIEHPDFAQIGGAVQIVKGADGRDLLRDTLAARGAKVATLDVYRRALPKVSAEQVAELEARWREDIDVVTLTSVATLEHLLMMLTDSGRTLLKNTPFVAVSERIVLAAASLELKGNVIRARGADEEAIVGAIAAWHARAR